MINLGNLSVFQLIIAVAGVLTGYNGSFEFEEPGQLYKDTPYIGMRFVSTSIQVYRTLIKVNWFELSPRFLVIILLYFIQF